MLEEDFCSTIAKTRIVLVNEILHVFFVFSRSCISSRNLPLPTP